MVKRLLWLVAFRRGMTALVLVLLTLAAVLEGVGLSLFFPLLETLASGGQGVIPSGLGAVVPSLTLLPGVPPAQRVRLMVAAIIVAIALKNVVGYAARVLIFRLGFLAQQDLQVRVFQTYVASDYAVFLERRQGRVVNDILQQTDSAAQAFIWLMEIAGHLITLGVYAALLLVFFWNATLMATALLAVVGLGVRLLLPLSNRLGAIRQQLDRECAALTAETVSGIRQVKVFALEAGLVDRFAELARQLSRINSRLRAVRFLGQPITEIVMVAALGVFLLVVSSGGPEGARAMVPLMMAFLLVVARLLPITGALHTKLLSLQSHAPSVKVVQEVLRLPTPSARSWGVPFDDLRERVAFHDVVFSYPGSEHVLHGVNAEFEKGKTTALIGPSGAGKSTVVDLLIRLYEPTAGRIAVDGVDLRELAISDWRRRIGFVSQDTFIFNASIRDNIALGCPGAREADIVWAAQQADAHEFIERLPDGYDTVVGERGLKLSGGERQRLAIARAVLRRPSLLIFDEATSSLDYESERRVQQAMARIGQDRTVVMVAHRLSSVMGAQKIIVLDQGVVVDQGTHEELRAREGFYQRLYQANALGAGAAWRQDTACLPGTR